MFSAKGQPSEGLTIVVLRVRDRTARALIESHLCDFGEQITPTIYELDTADWDQNAWDETVHVLENALAGTEDRLLVWRFSGSTYSRFTIRGSA